MENGRHKKTMQHVKWLWTISKLEDGRRKQEHITPNTKNMRTGTNRKTCYIEQSVVLITNLKRFELSGRYGQSHCQLVFTCFGSPSSTFYVISKRCNTKYVRIDSSKILLEVGNQDKNTSFSWPNMETWRSRSRWKFPVCLASL